MLLIMSFFNIQIQFSFSFTSMQTLLWHRSNINIIVRVGYPVKERRKKN